MVALASVSLIIAPFGCQTVQLVGGDAADGNSLFGLLVNTNTDSNVLGGVKLASGESVFVYGQFGDDGSIEEIAGAVFRNAQGQEAVIVLDQGRPTLARGFDGSTIEFTYDQVSSERLTGHVDLFFAQDGSHETILFDVDLNATAEQLVQTVSELTGVDLTKWWTDASARTTSSTLPASEARRALGGVLQALLLGATFAFVGYAVLAVMTQVMEAVMLSVSVVAAAVIASVFLPFVLLGEVLRTSGDLPASFIDFDLLDLPMTNPLDPLGLLD
ncbi:MAG TPA: hypothetical protein VMZ31_20545 [Phycisphaerae bacterium]|nr:hypothetical protein [Phycisphaerae bacterium]